MPTYHYHCNTCKKNFDLPWNTDNAICSGCKKPGKKLGAPLANTSPSVPVTGSPSVKKSLIQPIRKTPVTSPNIPPVANANDLSDAILQYIFSHCDEKSLALLSMVCKRWKYLGADLLKRFIPLMSVYGSTTSNLKATIMNYIGSAQSIQLAVDQFPYPHISYGDSILAHILANNIAIDLTLGTKDSDTLAALNKAKNQMAAIFNTSGKITRMHNKIWVIDYEGIILGSPNVSFAGLQGNNYESCIYIKSPRLGKLFGKYLELIRMPNLESKPQWKEVKDSLDKYNKEEHHLKIALAPVMHITDFIIEQLAGASKIIIRQFLISPKKRGTGVDILTVLCKMSYYDHVDIEVYLDEGAYYSKKSDYFVQPAASRMVRSGIKVFLQKHVIVVKTQEGIQHDKLILATTHKGVQRTLLGSAGFTREVIANENAENFISTDVPAIFDSLMKHHKETLVKDITTRLSK